MPTAINTLVIFLVIALGLMAIFFIVGAAVAQYDIWIKRRNGITHSLRNTSLTTAIFLLFNASAYWLIIGNVGHDVILGVLVGSFVSVVLLTLSLIQLVYHGVTADE